MEHRIFTAGNVTVDEVIAGDIRFQISRLGAEMISLARLGSTGWTGFLHRDGIIQPPASGWANHATVMGYFLHRLWKEQSVYRGHLIKGGNHGFLRHLSFGEPQVLDDGLVYTVLSSQIPTGAYPFKVRLDLSYRIVGEALRVEFRFTNEEDADAHVSFGLHPGFAVASLDSAAIHFPPGVYRRHMAPGNFLNGEVETLSFAGGEMPYDRARLGDSFLLELAGLTDKQFSLSVPERGTQLDLDFTDVPYMTLWSDSSDFICIEPCWGLPDSNPPVPFEQKAGIQRIGPRARISRSFSLTPSFL